MKLTLNTKTGHIEIKENILFQNNLVKIVYEGGKIVQYTKSGESWKAEILREKATPEQAELVKEKLKNPHLLRA